MNRLLSSVLLVSLLAACGPATETPPSADTTPAPADAPATGADAPAATDAPAVADAPAAPSLGASVTTPPAGPQPVAVPTLVVDTLDDGPFDLAAQRGQWVVVNFWATWCKPCLKEIPDLTALDAARDDVRVIGLAYEEIDPDAMRDFLKKHPAGYPIAIVDTFSPPADFETPRGLPMTYLIAPDGAVARKFLGPITGAELEAAILEHAAGATGG